MEFMLPRPTEDELNLGMKGDYFERILEMDFDKKYKIHVLINKDNETIKTY